MSIRHAPIRPTGVEPFAIETNSQSQLTISCDDLGHLTSVGADKNQRFLRMGERISERPCSPLRQFAE